MEPLVTITRRFEWDMAHRLGKDYPGKCAKLHGHRYVAEAAFTCDAFSEHGMVIDLGEIKEICKGWVDLSLDHGTIVSEEDRSLITFLHDEGQRYWEVPFSTTVENICPYLAEVFQNRIRHIKLFRERNVNLHKLTVWETPNGYATWRVGRRGSEQVGLAQCENCKGSGKITGIAAKASNVPDGSICPTCKGKGFNHAYK